MEVGVTGGVVGEVVVGGGRRGGEEELERGREEERRSWMVVGVTLVVGVGVRGG